MVSIILILLHECIYMRWDSVKRKIFNQTAYYAFICLFVSKELSNFERSNKQKFIKVSKISFVLGIWQGILSNPFVIWFPTVPIHFKNKFVCEQSMYCLSRGIVSIFLTLIWSNRFSLRATFIVLDLGSFRYTAY